MLPTILQIHIVVAVLYLIFILIKIISMIRSVTNFEKLKTRTRLLQIVLDSLLVISGVILIFYSPSRNETWFWVKFTLFLAVIPLSIIGFKRNNKFLAILSLVIMVYLYGLSETKNLSFKSDKRKLKELSKKEDSIEIKTASLDAGKNFYNATCIRCHGEDGKKGYFNAKNLTESELNDNEMFIIITYGKGVMPGYSFLDSTKRRNIIEYIRGFRK